MKKFILMFLITFLYTSLFAQDEKPKEGWETSGVAAFNISQVALSNWTQGGDNSLAFNIVGNFAANYYDNPWQFKNSLKISFGKTKIGNQELRTADNEIYLEDILSYSVGWVVDPYISDIFRTVLAKGYDYESSPFVQTAAFLDPGYLQQGFGFIYQTIPNWHFKLGLGTKETITSQFTSYSDDPETADVETFKFETGIETGIKGEAKLQENILFTTDLGMFSAFDNLSVWDVRWDNTLTAKFSEIFNVNFNFQLLYDTDQTLKTQIKEALQIGLTYTLF